MRIRWHGHSCFEITNEITLVTDPHDEHHGKKRGENIGKIVTLNCVKITRKINRTRFLDLLTGFSPREENGSAGIRTRVRGSGSPCDIQATLQTQTSNFL